MLRRILVMPGRPALPPAPPRRMRLRSAGARGSEGESGGQERRTDEGSPLDAVSPRDCHLCSVLQPHPHRGFTLDPVTGAQLA